MLKRLTLVLALVLVAGMTCAAYAEVQNVKVSGDIEVIAAMRNLELRQYAGAGNPAAAIGQTTHPDDFLATITRVMISADLTDNVSTVVRLLNERYWGKESDNLGTGADENTDIVLDLAYVTLKEFLYSPLTMTIGRQELHFGNDMIVGDPDTNNRVTNRSPFGNLANRPNADLTARKSFDAIRATLNYDPVVVDIVGAKIRENVTNSQDDIDLYGINIGWDVSKKMKVEGYFWQKNLGRKTNTANSGVTQPQNKRRYTDVIGSRVSGEPIDGLTYSLEQAFQFGKYNQNDLANNVLGTLAGGSNADTVTRVGQANATSTVDIRAWALEAFLNYDFKKAKYTPSVGACYAYFSGDAADFDGNSAERRTGWDPMFENQTFGRISNALFNQTNQHIAGLNASFKPFQDVTVKGEYYGYWVAKASQDHSVLGAAAYTVARPAQAIYITKSGFIGQELDVTLTYDYTEDVQFNLMGDVFFPGNTFSSSGEPTVGLNGKSDNAATEVIGSMKVTF